MSQDKQSREPLPHIIDAEQPSEFALLRAELQQSQLEVRQMREEMREIQGLMKLGLQAHIAEKEADGAYQAFLELVEASIRGHNSAGLYKSGTEAVPTFGQERVAVCIADTYWHFADRAVQEGRYDWTDARQSSIIRAGARPEPHRRR